MSSASDSAVFGEADLHAALDAGARAADEVFLFAADAHHHRGIEFFGQQRGNDHGEAAGDLAAESAAGVLADEDDLVLVDVHPLRNRGPGLEGALRSGMKEELAVLPVGHGGAGFEALMADVGSDEGFVEDQRGILEAGVDVADRTTRRAHGPWAGGPGRIRRSPRRST